MFALQSKIDEAQRVACVCHVNPDGDALGSTLAVAAWMKALGKECTVVVPNRFPDFLQWMPGASEIVRYDKNADKADAILRQADLLWVCDMNAPSRALGMESILAECMKRSAWLWPTIILTLNQISATSRSALQRCVPPAKCSVTLHGRWDVWKVSHRTRPYVSTRV